jgi:hypothetical protein
VEWFKLLQSLKVEIQEDWANSLYVGETGDETLQRNAAALGQVNLISRLMQATVEEITEINYDNK